MKVNPRINTDYHPPQLAAQSPTSTLNRAKVSTRTGSSPHHPPGQPRISNRSILRGRKRRLREARIGGLVMGGDIWLFRVRRYVSLPWFFICTCCFDFLFCFVVFCYVGVLWYRRRIRGEQTGNMITITASDNSLRAPRPGSTPSMDLRETRFMVRQLSVDRRRSPNLVRMFTTKPPISLPPHPTETSFPLPQYSRKRPY